MVDFNFSFAYTLHDHRHLTRTGELPWPFIDLFVSVRLGLFIRIEYPQIIVSIINYSFETAMEMELAKVSVHRVVCAIFLLFVSGFLSFFPFSALLSHSPVCSLFVSRSSNIIRCSAAALRQSVCVCVCVWKCFFHSIWFVGDGKRDDDNCETINGHSTVYPTFCRHRTPSANNKNETKTKRIKPSKREIDRVSKWGSETKQKKAFRTLWHAHDIFSNWRCSWRPANNIQQGRHGHQSTGRCALFLSLWKIYECSSGAPMILAQRSASPHIKHSTFRTI